MYCYYQKTALVPEWQVGDVIAQRTERQGTLPFDFFDVDFPQFKIPSLKEIRVSTHLNFELRSDFITEFAQQAVKPINEFTTDLQGKIPNQIGDDINVDSPIDDVNIDVDLDEIDKPIKEINDAIDNADKALKDATSQFESKTFSEQLAELGFFKQKQEFERDLAEARYDAQKITQEIQSFNTQKFQKFYEIIEFEKQKTGEMQNIIDALQKEKTILA